METYTFLRQMADSWFLLGMTVFFLGAIFWAFRPGARKGQDEAASSIFRNERHPAAAPPEAGAAARSHTKEA